MNIHIQHKNKGVTLVEMLIVLGIFAILITIAIPSWVRQRENSRGRTCQENLTKIEGAVEQWAYENNVSNGSPAPPLYGGLCGPDKYIKNNPQCPGGGTYYPGLVGGIPSCSIGTFSYPYEPHILVKNN